MSANLKAFAGAAVLVAGISLVLAGVLGGGGGDAPETVAGETKTPLVLPSSASPGPAPTPVPTLAGTPIAAPFDVPIMMYHRVAPDLPADEFDARLTVTTAALEEQLAYLDCAGYTTITMQQLFDAIDGKTALPARPIILTFDDGWIDHYTYAFPLMQQHGDVASFGVVTGFVEAGGPYMTWSQIREMADAGMEIMSHSVSHVDLGTSDDATVVSQITESKAALEDAIGREVPYFVYPAGEPFRSGTEARQAQVVSMLADAGYRAALLAGPDGVTQDPAAPFALSRVRVSGGEDIYTFAGSIHGPAPDVPCQ